MSRHVNARAAFLREGGVEPPHPRVLDPKSSASASSATLARKKNSERAARSGNPHPEGVFSTSPKFKTKLGCEGFEPTTD